VIDILAFMQQGKSAYRARRIECVLPAVGVGVTTRWVDGVGFETALVGTSTAHSVERYASEELAHAGHKKWVAKTNLMTENKKYTILTLGLETLGSEEITIVPRGISNA